MAKYRVNVPPTMKIGSFTAIVSNEFDDTYKKDALWQYNSAREHDNLPPVKRMPKGTKYTRMN